MKYGNKRFNPYPSNQPAQTLTWTEHAIERACERGIPTSVVSELIRCGHRQYDHQGGIRIDLKADRARRRFAQRAGTATLNRFADAYVVIATDQAAILTVGWRFRRNERDPAPRSHKRRLRRPRIRSLSGVTEGAACMC